MVVSQRLRLAFVSIDAEKCKGCHLCISVCPKGIISPTSYMNRSGNIPVAFQDGKTGECTGCIACAIMCPDSAISVRRHSKSS